MNNFAPMLAQSMPATEATIERLQGTHWFDLKIDGVRGLMIINNGTVKLQNRNAVDITYRYPELVQAALTKFGSDVRLILDGEIVVLDDGGKPSFKLTSKRDRQQRANVIASLAASMPATFMAFDLLYQDTFDWRSAPWLARAERLASLVVEGEHDARIRLNVGSMDGDVMMAMVREHSLEGLVAKRIDSPYQSGRRSQWVKIKPTITGSFLVTGTTPGTGSRQDTFGSLVLAVVHQDGKLQRVGEVGSGFKAADLRDVVATLASGSDLIVEVEFQEVTVDGALRFPVFKGIRSDLVRSDADPAQLGAPCDESKSSSAMSSTSTSLPGSTSTMTTASVSSVL
jgi:bifunctional non-homologous end joining protein LigD